MEILSAQLDQRPSFSYCESAVAITGVILSVLNIFYGFIFLAWAKTAYPLLAFGTSMVLMFFGIWICLLARMMFDKRTNSRHQFPYAKFHAGLAMLIGIPLGLSGLAELAINIDNLFNGLLAVRVAGDWWFCFVLLNAFSELHE